MQSLPHRSEPSLAGGDARLPYTRPSGGDGRPLADALGPADAIAPSRNRLLSAMPPHELALLLPRLERVQLEADRSLRGGGEPIEHVWFPETALVGVRLDGEDEIDAVGRDGMVGVPAVLGERTDGDDMIVRVPGIALRLRADALQSVMHELPSLRPLLERHVLARLRSVARTASCSRTHLLAPRLAAMLLWVRDQTGEDRLPLTHAQLAQLLGVSRRASVTAALRVLRSRGVVRLRRGGVLVEDVGGLVDAACPCYPRRRADFDRAVAPLA